MCDLVWPGALIVMGLVVTVLAGVSHWFSLRMLRQGSIRRGTVVFEHHVGDALGVPPLFLAGLWALLVWRARNKCNRKG